MARVCVVGSVNSDLVFDVAALPGPGETVLASALRTLPGGKGGNQAVAAARAGAEVTLVAAVGDDAAGRTLLDHLSANGVGTEGVVTLPVPSGTAVVVVGAGGENMIVVAPGANAHLTLDSQHLRTPSPTPMSCCCSWRFPSRRHWSRRVRPAKPGRRSSSTPPRSAPTRARWQSWRRWSTSSSSTRRRRRRGSGRCRIW